MLTALSEYTHTVSQPAHCINLPDSQCSCVCNIRSRLKAKNLMYIKQILFVIEGLVRVMGGQCVQTKINVS